MDAEHFNSIMAKVAAGMVISSTQQQDNACFNLMDDAFGHQSNGWDCKRHYRRLLETLEANRYDRYEPLEHALAKARLKKLLETCGYKVKTEYDVPCYDHWGERKEYRLDLYAELVLPMDMPGTELGYVEVIHDRMAIEIGGLNTYHESGGKRTNSGRPFRKVREGQKKELICQCYDIPMERYFIVERDEAFSPKYMISDEQMLRRFSLRPSSAAAATRTQ